MNNINYHLTFDIDWAPDCCVEQILLDLKKNSVKATFFITHASDINDEIINQGHHIGLHPNFFPNSTHGKSTLEIIEGLLKIANNASSIRTHGLFQSTSLFIEIFSNFPQLKLDISNLTYKSKYIERTKMTYETAKFERINFNWEDDVAFFDQGFNWSSEVYYGKLNIYNFHPIHIFLNSCSMKNYEKLKSNIGNKNLNQLKKNEVSNFINYDSAGARTFLNSLIMSDYKSVLLENIK